MLRRQVLPGHYGKAVITVNGTTPGPTIRVNLGQTVQVNVTDPVLLARTVNCLLCGALTDPRGRLVVTAVTQQQ